MEGKYPDTALGGGIAGNDAFMPPEIISKSQKSRLPLNKFNQL
jgi:hypothetical protein